MFLVNEEVVIGVVWLGDVFEIMSENDKLNYVVSEEGLNLWFDNMVILKMVKNVEGVYKFMNFMLDFKYVV